MKTTPTRLALGASFVVSAVVSAGCADPSIDMSLKMPAANQMPANFDLSCVTAVEVSAVGNQQESMDAPADVHSECVDLVKAPTSFADIRNAIAGKFDLKLPQSGLAGVKIRGTVGACSDKLRFYEANFFGGTPYAGEDSLSIPVVPNISCNATKSYTVSTIDLRALTQTKQCAMSLPTGTGPINFAGNIRPSLLGAPFPKMIWEDGPSDVQPDDQSKALVASWSAAATPRSCIGMGYDSSTNTAESCINPGSLTLCAGANEIELPVIDFSFAGASVDTAIARDYGQPVFGAIYKQSAATVLTKAPIVGATVELEDPTQGKVVYVTPTSTKYVPIQGGTSTGPDGLFMVYLKGEAATLIVKSGTSQQRYTVATQDDQLSATLLAVLP
jgi:hypothetical protein